MSKSQVTTLVGFMITLLGALSTVDLVPVFGSFGGKIQTILIVAGSVLTAFNDALRRIGLAASKAQD